MCTNEETIPTTTNIVDDKASILIDQLTLRSPDVSQEKIIILFV